MKSFNFSKVGALVFLFFTAGLAYWSIANFDLITSRIDSNVFSLLPKSERNPVAEEFVSRVASNGERSLVILIGSDDIKNSIGAEKELRSEIKGLDLHSLSGTEDLSSYISLLKSHKSGLITPEDIALLDAESPNYWFEKANALAYSMGGLAVPWRDDPFGLLSNWIYKLSGYIKVRPYGDSLIAQYGDKSYVVIPLELNAASRSMQEQAVVADSINAAITHVRSKFSGVQILRSGVVFIASDTAKVTQEDISAIGLVSAIAALILIASVFRSIAAIAMVMVTVSIGFLYAVLVCFFIFPKIYILTLAFGTSLIGMSVDYCLYWLTASVDAVKNPFERRRYLFPGMLLALATTVIGYLLLAATPFPVLSQMAIFSIGGIIAAWLTVLLMFPYASRLKLHTNGVHRIVDFIRPGFLHSHQLLRRLLIVLIVLVSGYGLLTFRTNDDIRALASFNKDLVNEQVQVSKILDIPSPSQFFIVSGNSEEDVLVRTEALGIELDRLKAKDIISGYQSVTQYIQSIHSQQEASKSYASPSKEQALKRVAKEMGMSPEWVRNESQVNQPLTVADLQSLPIFKKLGYLWFDSSGSSKSTAVLLTGVRGQLSVDALSKLASANVVWVDKPQEISNIFQRYRELFSYLIGIGYLLTFIAVYLKYRNDAWRAILSPILATCITLAAMTVSGETIGLLSVIAFSLLLGVGTDYGIFLLQYPGDRKVLFSISLAALMTLISFGSLSLSSVPALHSFGITLLLGISLSWLLTIFFAKVIRDRG